ncbi:hypothetical protein L3X37_14075 [Sabulilitoribacter arenilitoris]|uniref:Uncharacterized protein n=1 Tax=Wocania arenilitoris TaxID=2044858 RepID=A0AAE3ERS0_9FLAO|nr:hypothetical protein [Wocania arenilitoris]MCF7569477.1 hypothetical protein [Wocania arenilitoris]
MSTKKSKHSLNSFGNGQAKYKHFTAQLKMVYKALMYKPMTMKEVDVFTGVMRENICRYIDTLLEQNKIAIIRKRKCSITGYPYVNEYTANPDLFPKSNQLKLF